MYDLYSIDFSLNFFASFDETKRFLSIEKIIFFVSNLGLICCTYKLNLSVSIMISSIECDSTNCVPLTSMLHFKPLQKAERNVSVFNPFSEIKHLMDGSHITTKSNTYIIFRENLESFYFHES